MATRIEAAFPQWNEYRAVLSSIENLLEKRIKIFQMNTDEKTDVKLSTKVACYKLQLLDVQQECRVVQIQKEIRTLETRNAECKLRAAQSLPIVPPVYDEDTADHARLLRLGERVTSNNPDLEWDKNSDDIHLNDITLEFKSEPLVDFTTEMEEDLFNQELVELREAYNLEFVLFAKKKLIVQNFVRCANLADDEVKMWAGSVENFSYFEHYNTADLSTAQHKAISYMGRKTVRNTDLYTKEINAELYANDGEGLHAPFKEQAEFINTKSTAVKTGGSSVHAHFHVSQETSNVHAIIPTLQDKPNEVEHLLIQLDLDDSGPQTISQQIKESQYRLEAAGSHSASFKERRPRFVADKTANSNRTPILEYGTSEICQICQTINCTDLTCWA